MEKVKNDGEFEERLDILLIEQFRKNVGKLIEEHPSTEEKWFALTKRGRFSSWIGPIEDQEVLEEMCRIECREIKSIYHLNGSGHFVYIPKTQKMYEFD